MRISDWSSDVCSSDLHRYFILLAAAIGCVYAGIMLYGAWDYWSKILRFGIDTEDLYVPRVILEALGGPDYEHEPVGIDRWVPRSEEHTSELQSLMRISYAVFCLQQIKQFHEIQ